MTAPESVEKVDTLLDGNAVRSKIKDFRTALYPRQYHPCTLEKPLVKRLFAYKVFFRRTCRRKNKIRLTAAKKLNLRFIDRLWGGRMTAPLFYINKNSHTRLFCFLIIYIFLPVSLSVKTGS